MFKSFDQFLNESYEKDLSLARKFAVDSEMKPVLDNCLEGVYSHISVIDTHGAKSFVAVALNDGAPICEVYNVSDPRIALLAIIIKNTQRDELEEVKSIIETHDSQLNYSVFGGDKKLTTEEILNRYNFKKPDNVVPPFITDTPITKIY